MYVMLCQTGRTNQTHRQKKDACGIYRTHTRTRIQVAAVLRSAISLMIIAVCVCAARARIKCVRRTIYVAARRGWLAAA